MRHRKVSTSAVRAAVATALLGNATLSHGAAFALLEQSTSRMGTAFAGTAAAADDATTVFFNPAGLVFLDDAQAIANVAAIEITSEFGNVASGPALLQPLGNDGGDAGNWNWVPSAYASLPLSNDLAIGVGVNAPFGLKLEYEDGWIGRFQALKSEIKTTNFNPTIAYRLNPAVAVGIGLDYQRIQAELTNAVNYSALIAQGVQQLVLSRQLAPAAAPGVLAAVAGVEGHARVRGDDDAWGFNIGAIFQLGQATRVGLHYRSTIDYTVTGTARFDSPTVGAPVGANILNAATVTGGPLANGPVSVDLKLPDSAVASLHHKLGRNIELLADVAWTGWSSVQELRVVRASGATLSNTPERWSDSWRFALGGTYAVVPRLKVRAGVAYDQTPVPDSTRTPRLPDVDRTWLAIGTHWKMNDAVAVDFAYAHLFSGEVPLNQDADNVNANALLLGDQSSDVDIVSLQVSLSF